MTNSYICWTKTEEMNKFNRGLWKNLENWRESKTRKPLVLRGARQVGKTTLVREFGREYSHYIELNLEKSKDRELFEKTDDIDVLVDSIFISNNVPSDQLSNTLLFIDEIQELPKAIQLLRYFYEEKPELHLISAGSLLEFALKDVPSFPVGRVEFMYLHPFNFSEFLNANESQVVFNELNKIPVSKAAHQTLMDLFNKYAIIGGMPEVIKTYLKEESMANLSKIYESIWSTYLADTEKYTTNSSSRNVMRHIMKTVAYEVDKRVKFQNFGNSTYRSREIGEAMRSLEMAKVIRLIYPTTSISPPIIPDFKKSPRIQLLDTGIINYSLGIISEMLLMDNLIGTYKGAIIPHIIFQDLISLQSETEVSPHFWVREKKQSSAEVDLVYSIEGKLIPIEIKSGATGSLKSLHQFIEKSDHPYAVRIYGGEFEIMEAKTPSGKTYILMNMPYYLGTKIPEYLRYFISNY